MILLVYTCGWQYLGSTRDFHVIMLYDAKFDRKLPGEDCTEVSGVCYRDTMKMSWTVNIRRTFSDDLHQGGFVLYAGSMSRKS